VIDLHLHTTASDGRSTPDALVGEALAAGVHTIAVTDHDTIAGLDVAGAAARQAGVTMVPGIEITAVDDGRDVHILGYFFDPAHAELASFLAEQRKDRYRRLVEIVDRLAALDVPVAPAVLEAHSEASGRSLGRPLVARALVDAGHVRDVQEAFSRYLADGRPAFVERRGAAPAEVVALIGRAGGIASVAHPRKRLESLVRALVPHGLAAVEAFHPDHDEDDVEKFCQIAVECGLVVTGGSDYHGPDSGRLNALGRVGLPEADFARLLERAGRSRPS
jgi:predicted metal-dependent phosphoesterase TrpH